MTMNNSPSEGPNDRFEARLGSQPIRGVPANWKHEILRAAVQAAPAQRIHQSAKSAFPWNIGGEWRWLLGLWSASLAALALLGVPSSQSPKPTVVPVGKLWSIYQIHHPEVLRLAALPDGDLPEPPIPPPVFVPHPHSALRRTTTNGLG